MDLNTTHTRLEKDDEKPIEEVKPKTRVEFEAYAKRLAAIITANSVSPRSVVSHMLRRLG